MILIFGGDGTIHRHLSQLVNLQLPVLVVPHGSGNDFARALNLRSVRDSVKAWRKFLSDANNVRTIDLGVISPLVTDPLNLGAAPPPQHHYFCCVGGVGLDAEVARRASNLPRWLRRHGGYALSLLSRRFSGLRRFLRPSRCPTRASRRYSSHAVPRPPSWRRSPMRRPMAEA